VPNGGVWGQPLRNYSVYPSPPPAGEVQFRIAEDTDLDWAVSRLRGLLEADDRVLADPAPRVLLDRSAADNALEIAVAFSTAGEPIDAVKSDLIKAAQTQLHHAIAQSFMAQRAGSVGLAGSDYEQNYAVKRLSPPDRSRGRIRSLTPGCRSVCPSGWFPHSTHPSTQFDIVEPSRPAHEIGRFLRPANRPL
jgi:hypothetical protein